VVTLPWAEPLPLLNECFMIASAVLVAIGWRAIRRARRDTHRRLMLTASAFGLAFFISYALRTVLVGDTSFGGPAAWRIPYLVFLQIHTVLATVAGILGIVTLRRALRGRFDLHRRIAPWTAVLWLVAAGTGLMVYLMLYVVFPPGVTTNLWRAVGG
jgi:putative membrane protein